MRAGLLLPALRIFLSLALCSAVAEGATGLEGTLFAAEARRVDASDGTEDDAALAEKLLAHGVRDPRAQELFFEQAYEFGRRDPRGLATALEALKHLAREAPERRPECRRKFLVVLRAKYQKSRGAQRRWVGETLVAHLLLMARDNMAAGHASEGITLCREARVLANEIEIPHAEAIKALREVGLKAKAIEGEIARLTEARRGKTLDRPGAMKLLMLLLVERDDPKQAASLLEMAGADARLRARARMAAQDAAGVSSEACRELARWYEDLSRGATWIGKANALRRAQGYYRTFAARRPGGGRNPLEDEAVRVGLILRKWQDLVLAPIDRPVFAIPILPENVAAFFDEAALQRQQEARPLALGIRAASTEYGHMQTGLVRATPPNRSDDYRGNRDWRKYDGGYWWFRTHAIKRAMLKKKLALVEDLKAQRDLTLKPPAVPEARFGDEPAVGQIGHFPGTVKVLRSDVEDRMLVSVEHTYIPEKGRRPITRSRQVYVMTVGAKPLVTTTGPTTRSAPGLSLPKPTIVIARRGNRPVIRSFDIKPYFAQPDPGQMFQPADAETAGRQKTLTLDLGKGIALRLVRIPAGTFLMGDASSACLNERPARRVTIGEAFYMGIHEVTVAQWKAVLGAAPWAGRPLVPPESDRHPAAYISWNDATRFCDKLAERTKLPLRLPTEAEWEYACRAGTTTPFHTGKFLLEGQANCYKGAGAVVDGPAPSAGAEPVGRYRPNAWGLYDMHGNVAEWCSDWYHPASYARGETSDPKGPPTGAVRVFRGGSWIDPTGLCRSAVRGSAHPDAYKDPYGFRIVLEALPAPPSGR